MVWLTFNFDVTRSTHITTTTHRASHKSNPNKLSPLQIPTTKMIDQRIFEDLQAKIDEETTVRDVSARYPRLA